jgi:hypothetical protein
MTDDPEPLDAGDAVRRFAADLAIGQRGEPCRIQAELDGPDGMARLCAVEAALAELWPCGLAKELVWLTRAAPGEAGVLHLRAFAPAGALVREASFPLAAPIPA